MVSFSKLQEIMTESLELDRSIQYVETVGPTLEAAISDAAALLDIPSYHIEFEIIEKGSAGFLGFGKKDWRLQAYERIKSRKKKHIESFFEEDTESKLPVVEDRDGDVFVFLQPGGEALIKVTAPSGNGRRASEKYALQFLEDRKVMDVDRNHLKNVLNEALGEYVKIGNYEQLSYNDSVARVEISENEMHAHIIVTNPGEGGCDISYESYYSILKNNRVVHGIKEEFLKNFVDQPIYNDRIEIAEASKPHDGKNAYIQYNFETEQSRARLRESVDGRVNFKELNIIQNVVEKQVLAKKIPPEHGIDGKTVTGKTLPAKNGVDIKLPVGTNVHVAEDNETILSDLSGQVVIVNGLINVEPVLTIEGDVNLKTGNIIFLGTVVVTGNVEDGFSVKAAGNIDIRGTVAKSELDAEGDIIIYQGINGKGGGHINAGKSLWARFIQNANIETGDMVFASDGIINSRVVAFNRIICQGKRAHIMGGRLSAREEINAKVLGNPTSGTETICEVGFDPKRKEELDSLQETKFLMEKQIDEVKLNIQTLVNQKKHKKVLSEDKEEYLLELLEKRDNLLTEFKKNQEEIQKIQEYLATLKYKGRISASSKVYPGVKIVIRDAKDEVRVEHKAVTFTLENGLIRINKYIEPDEESKRGPDAYSAN